MFLRKGATYRLIGSSHMPELMQDDAGFENDPTLKKFILSSASELKAELCNVDASGNCQYANTVTLDNTLNCVDTECDADTLRVVQVNEIHYEYVRPACVEQGKTGFISPVQLQVQLQTKSSMTRQLSVSVLR